MFHISGPEYISIFQHISLRKNIHLLGDEHWSFSGTCKRCDKSQGCFNVKDVIDTLSKRNKVDVFLEAKYTTQEMKKETKQQAKQERPKGPLDEVILAYHKQLYNKHTKQQQIRVHYSDFRFHTSLNLLDYAAYVLERQQQKQIIYPLTVISHFKTKNYFKKFADACIMSDDFVKDMQAIFGDESFIYVDKENLTSLKDTTTYIHRIRKQVKKTSVSMQKALISFHKKQCKALLNDQYNSNYNHARSLFIKRQSFDIEDNNESNNLPTLSLTINNWLSHLMDMYLLSRLIYYLENSDSKDILVYAGTKHIWNYQKFFETTVSKLFDKKWQQDKSIHIGEGKRCLTVPKDLLSD